MAFATPTQLGSHLQQDVNMSSATQALDMASGVIRAFCGWAIQKTTETVVLDSAGGDVLALPTLHLTALAAVVVDDGATDPATLVLDDDVAWSAAGYIYRRRTWPYRPRSVTVTMTHGYDPVPAEIVAVCLAIAGRAYVVEPGRTSIQVGARSESFRESADGFVPAAHESWILDRYRLPPRS